jgi:hypothetical protein
MMSFPTSLADGLLAMSLPGHDPAEFSELALGFSSSLVIPACLGDVQDRE